MAQGVERFFKAAIVDRTPAISSAALVSAYHLFPNAKDVVKRWVNEAQEAVNAKSSSSFFGSNSSGGGGYLGFGGSSQTSGTQALPSTSYITQYHALGLLFLIRQQDRMAVIKMIQQLGGGKSGAGTTLRNPMALCMLIRYAAKVMEEDPKYVARKFEQYSGSPYCNSVQRQFLELLEGWLRHKSDMVNFEAARAICEMRNVTPAQLTKSISGMCTARAPSPLHNIALSSTNLFGDTKASLEICGHTNSCYACFDSACKCCNMQHGSGNPYCGSQSQYCYLCYHNSAQGIPTFVGVNWMH